MITLPPRHLKTFLASICLPAWILAHHPSANILILSYGQELADKIAYAIREILRSDWFCRLFKAKIAKHVLTDFTTTANGCVRSVSIEGSVTGFGADIIIVDDAVQIKDCDNERQLQRVNGLFASEIRTRLDNPKKGANAVQKLRRGQVSWPRRRPSMCKSWWALPGQQTIRPSRQVRFVPTAEIKGRRRAPLSRQLRATEITAKRTSWQPVLGATAVVFAVASFMNHACAFQVLLLRAN